DAGIQVSKVREQATGHIFQVHVFHADVLPEFDRICRLLPEVPPHLNVAIEAARSPNSGYIRTTPLPHGVGILQWAAAVSPAPSLHPSRAPLLSLAPPPQAAATVSPPLTQSRAALA